MSYKSLLLILICISNLACDKQSDQSQSPISTHQAVAFIDVNVIPMDAEHILERQTVIVRDGKITAIEPTAKVQIPGSVFRIDGRGKYLMPGLAEMHTHLGNKAQLLLYIANGVTTVRNMWGNPSHLQWRELISRGELLGPTIYTAGDIVDGSPPQSGTVVETAQEAAREVAEQKAAGYDFIKVYNNLSKEAYNGLVAAAKEHGMPVAGHVPSAVGLEGVFSAGQASIEHLHRYIYELVAPDAAKKVGDRFFPLQSRIVLWNYVDKTQFPKIAKATRDAGVWNTPTLAIFNHYSCGIPEEFLAFITLPEMQYFSDDRQGEIEWIQRRSIGQTEFSYEDVQRGKEVRMSFVKALHDAGARLLLGTDYWMMGFSIHYELQSFVDAGLTHYEAIKAGTSDAAEFLNAADTFGTVAVGKRADLILVNGNPLEDVRNVARRTGVMVRGQWLPEEKLQEMLEVFLPTIRVADAEHLDEALTVALGTSPQISPDGQTVYYIGHGPEHEKLNIVQFGDDNQVSRLVRTADLMSVSRKGGLPSRVTEGVIPGGYDLSSDGQTVVFSGYLTEGSSYTPALFTITAAGGKPRILIDGVDTVARWSPDGSLIAYTDGSGGLFVIPGQGGKPRKLVHVSSLGEWSWSPNGKYIAAFGYIKPKGDQDILIIPVSGGKLQRLTLSEEDSKWKEGLEWHPDGQRLTYHLSMKESETRQAYLDGRPTTFFLNQPEHWDYLGTWAPDGKNYFFRSSNTGWEVYFYNTENGTFTFLYSGSSLPTWSRDGRTIAWITTTLEK